MAGGTGRNTQQISCKEWAEERSTRRHDERRGGRPSHGARLQVLGLTQARTSIKNGARGSPLLVEQHALCLVLVSGAGSRVLARLSIGPGRVESCKSMYRDPRRVSGLRFIEFRSFQQRRARGTCRPWMTIRERERERERESFYSRGFPSTCV